MNKKLKKFPYNYKKKKINYNCFKIEQIIQILMLSKLMYIKNKYKN